MRSRTSAATTVRINGDTLCLVDAAYALFLQRFMIASEIEYGPARWVPAGSGMDQRCWRPTVTGSVAETFVPEFKASMTRYGYHIGTLFAEEAAAAANTDNISNLRRAAILSGPFFS